MPAPAVLAEIPPVVRPEGRVNWRERRARYERLAGWWHRWQAGLCVAALLIVGASIGYLQSQGWNLPWNLPEDSSLMRLLEGFTGGAGGLPTGPVPRK